MIDELRQDRTKLESKFDVLSRRLSLSQAFADSSEALDEGLGQDGLLVPSAATTAAGQRGEWEEARKALQRRIVEQDATIAESNKDFASFRKEVASNELQLQRSLREARDQSSESLRKATNYEIELKHLRSSYEQLGRGKQQLEGVVDQLRKKNNEFSSLVLDFQKKLQASNLEASAATDSLKRAQAQLANKENELALLAKSESRLQVENSELSASSQRKDSLLGRLEALQSQMGAEDAEERKRLARDRDALQTQWVASKRELEEERRAYRSLESAKGAELAELRSKLDQERGKLSEAREALVKATTVGELAEKRVGKLEGELLEAKAQLEALLKQRVAPEQLDLSGPMYSSLGAAAQKALDLTTALEENEQLQKGAEEAEQVLQRLRADAAESEEQLSLLKASSDEYRKQAETRLSALSLDKQKLTSRVEELRAICAQTETEFEQLRESMESKLKEAATKLAEAERQEQRVKEELGKQREEVQRLQGELQQREEEAQRSLQRYESELLERASNVEQLRKLRAATNATEQELATAKLEVARSQDNLAVAEQSWEKQRERLDGEVKVNIHPSNVPEPFFLQLFMLLFHFTLLSFRRPPRRGPQSSASKTICCCRV